MTWINNILTSFNGQSGTAIHANIKATVDEVQAGVDTLEADKSDITHNHDLVYSDIAHDHTALEITKDNTSNLLTSATVGESIDELANVGLGNMTAEAPLASQNVTTTVTKIAFFDTTKRQINGAVTCTTDTGTSATHKFLVNKAGVYRIYGVIGAEFASANELSLVLYKNGTTPVSPPVTLQGRGAGKPISFTYIDLIDLVPTDYLEIWAYADAASVATVIPYSTMVVERTIF